MSRLPVVGSDDSTWGTILNDFLSVAHNADGTLKTSAVSSKADDTSVVHNTGAETVAGVKTFSSSPVVPTPTTSTQAANKSYVDGVVGSGAPDATTTSKGIVQLAGDLGGTAASPTVPGLANKVGSVTAADGTITIGGTSTAPTVAVNSIAEAKVTNLTTDLAAKATDSAVVHNTGAETIAGVKTFSSAPVVPSSSFPESAVTNLTTDLAAKYTKPVSGIPKTDLDSSVQTSLTTADARDAAKLQGTDVDPSAPNDGQALIYNLASTSWVPATVSSTTVSDATASSKGIVQLAGDLGGTAAAPTVPGLANKVGSVTAADATITVGGTATAPTIGVGSIPESAVTNLTTDLAAKATDSAVVHNTGAETIAGVKTFSSAPVVPSGAFPESAVTNLTTDLAAKATDTAVVHLAGVETITGNKNFTGTLSHNSNAVVDTTDARLVAEIVYSRTGTLTATASGNAWLASQNITIVDVRAAVGTAPVGSSIIIDILKNGTTIFTTQGNRPSIAASAQKTASSAVPDVTAAVSGDLITMSIAQVGSTTPGADLTVFIRYIKG